MWPARQARLVTSGGDLADEVRRVVVTGVATGFDAEQCDGGVGDVAPVGEELGCLVVEEREPCEDRLCGKRIRVVLVTRH